MGTPQFGATILSAILASHHQLAGVVTRPDRPHGRGRRMDVSIVAALAASHGLPVLKPLGKRDPAFLASMKSWSPEVTVVAAFGMILPPEVLAVAPRGNVNVHASLLPKYRGAAPVQNAIIKGESLTGCTTMLMDEGLDTGDILLQREVTITASMTAGELEDELATVGAELIVETLDAVEKGSATPVRQDSSQATYTSLLKSSDGDILWNQTALETHNMIRGCTPRPGARLFHQERPIRIWKAAVDDCLQGECRGKQAGTVLDVAKGGVRVVCAQDTSLLLCEVQPPGRSRMHAADWARGARLLAGEFSFERDRPTQSD